MASNPWRPNQFAPFSARSPATITTTSGSRTVRRTDRDLDPLPPGLRPHHERSAAGPVRAYFLGSHHSEKNGDRFIVDGHRQINHSAGLSDADFNGTRLDDQVDVANRHLLDKIRRSPSTSTWTERNVLHALINKVRIPPTAIIGPEPDQSVQRHRGHLPAGTPRGALGYSSLADRERYRLVEITAFSEDAGRWTMNDRASVKVRIFF